MTPAAAAPAKRATSIERLLWWAFQTERAQLWTDTIAEAAGRTWGRDACAVILDRQILGTTIDYCGGSWRRHDDADMVAEAVSLLEPTRALVVAEHARAGTRPDSLVRLTPRAVPADGYRQGPGRPVAKTRVHSIVETVSKRGHKARREVIFTPIVWRPQESTIVAARVVYEMWWNGLDLVRQYGPLQHLRDWTLLDVMPPREPWR